MQVTPEFSMREEISRAISGQSVQVAFICVQHTDPGINSVIIVRLWRFEIFDGKGRLGFHFMESLMRPKQATADTGKGDNKMCYLEEATGAMM
jgi:hypothetical protein